MKCKQKRKKREIKENATEQCKGGGEGGGGGGGGGGITKNKTTVKSSCFLNISVHSLRSSFRKTSMKLKSWRSTINVTIKMMDTDEKEENEKKKTERKSKIQRKGKGKKKEKIISWNQS